MNLHRLVFGLLLGRRPPRVRGRLSVPGLEDRISIGRDRHGVPFVHSSSWRDAWFGLGFCQSQDRSFQLEILLRAARGSLSELIGPQGLGVDRLARRMRFRRAAEEAISVQEPDVRAALDGFAAGVRAGGRWGGRRPAHEFALLRRRPTPYEPEDVLAISGLMSFLLSANWDQELARLELLEEGGPEALRSLLPPHPEEPPPELPAEASIRPALDRLGEDLAGLLGRAGGGGASNNWALGPGRTLSGRALVANDIHLDPALPSPWYLAHLSAPGGSLAGAALVGTPVIAAGHNGAVAWGVTAGLTDVTDLFVEQLGPDGRSVRVGDRFEPCRVEEELISVRGGDNVREQVLITDRGPVIGAAPESSSLALSMRSTWQRVAPIRGLFRAARAGSCEELLSEMAAWPTVPLNVVCADDSGSIAWQMIGDAPRRRCGFGTFPLPAWRADAGWDGCVPFEEMPRVLNPPSGVVASANNRPRARNGPFLGADWIDDFRFERVTRVLGGRADWNATRAAALQMDLDSPLWQEMRDAVLEVPPTTPRSERALRLLRGWDGWAGADSSGAAVFELLVAELTRRVVDARAPAAPGASRGFVGGIKYTALGLRRASRLARLVREQPEGWLERPWREEIADALDAVVVALEARSGPSPDAWGWGHVRPLTFRHPLGVNRPLSRIFDSAPVAIGGDANTVAQAAVAPLAPTANPLLVATFRMVVEVGAWDEARFVLAGGQSGNPLSRNYEDQLRLWARGESVRVAWSPGRIEAVTRASLELRPAPDRGRGRPRS